MMFHNDEQLRDMLRSRLGYKKTQAALARELGIGDSDLSLFLAGKKQASSAMLQALGYETDPYWRQRDRRESRRKAA